MHIADFFICHNAIRCTRLSSTRRPSRSMDEKLALRTRIGIRLHLMVCHLCTTYRKQLLLIRKAINKLEMVSDPEPDITPLPDDAAKKIKAHLDSIKDASDD